MEISDDFQKRLIATLKEKGASSNCEICNKNNWSIVNEGVALNISDFSGGLRLPQPNIPSAAMICNNCGNIRLFSLGVLNLLPEKQQNVENKDKGNG